MKNLPLVLAILLCSGVKAENPDSAQFYLKKGIEEKAARRWLMAHNNFTKSLSFQPSLTDALIEDGYTALEMRKTDLAKEDFAKVLELQPENKVAVKELTSLYFNYRQYDKAIELAKRCPDCDNAQRIIGISYYQKEDYPQAVKYLSAVVLKDGSDAEAVYTLGRTYLDMEEYKKAVPFFEKAITLDASKNTWAYELALLYYNNDDYKNAVRLFKSAADHGYVQSNDYNENLGYASLYNNDFEKGEAILLAIWQRKPGDKDILRDIAEILYKKDQFDRSLEYCQKLIELDANDGKALYQAGLCFLKKGQKDKGQAMCDKAISLDPSLDGLRKKKEIVGM